MKNKPNKEFLNKKARFDYEITKDIEAGVVLTGVEIKSIRAGKLSLSGSYIRVIKGELFWVGGNISLGEEQNDRSIKILLHKEEAEKVIYDIEKKKISVVPLKAYFKRGRLKILIGLGRGRKKVDKRHLIKNRDIDRELAQKNRN